jgi:nucleolar pre-ribosomal-associated protein 1
LFHGTAFSSHSHLYILIKAYNTTELLATRTAITSLLKDILSDSILFQEDAEELYFWLDALPITRRAPGAEAPDGAPLTDEGDSVVNFLDDCIQRCLKSPYRYLEDRDVLLQSTCRNVMDVSGDSAYQEVHCSPLLITVLEQLGAKLAGKLLTPSDTLAITSFIRKLVFKLSAKQRNLDFLGAFVNRVDALVHNGLFPQYPSITTAIRREIPILRRTLHHLQSISEPQPSSTRSIIQAFLNRIEQVPTR